MMEQRIGKTAEVPYSAMRFVAGALYACHGAQKIFGAFGGHVAARPSLAFAAGLIETVAGPLIAGGLFTRVAAFVASGEMAVAYFLRHAPRGSWPIVNRGELAVAFCFLFLFVAARGGGRWSIDAALRRT